MPSKIGKADKPPKAHKVKIRQYLVAAGVPAAQAAALAHEDDPAATAGQIAAACAAACAGWVRRAYALI
jgi:hypothetical protein